MTERENDENIGKFLSNENAAVNDEAINESSDCQSIDSELIQEHDNNTTPNTHSEECAENVEEPEDEWLDITGSGDFKLRVLKPGKGTSTRPKQGSLVILNYSCYDNEDNKIEEVSNFELCLGDLDMVQAIDLAIPFMEVEQVAEVLVPSRLAYGKIGRPPDIKPDMDLRYEIEILKVLEDFDEDLDASKVLQLGNRKRTHGNFWYGRAEYLNAIHCYQKAAKILDGTYNSPENTPELLQNILDVRIKVCNNMAAAQLKMESYDESLKSLDFVLDIQPDNIKAHFRKAKVFMAKGETDQALASMRKAAELEPETKIIQQELLRLTFKVKHEENTQRAMYKRMFPQSASKPKFYKKWLKPWSLMAGGCMAVAVALAAYRQYFV